MISQQKVAWTSPATFRPVKSSAAASHLLHRHGCIAMLLNELCEQLFQAMQLHPVCHSCSALSHADHCSSTLVEGPDLQGTPQQQKYQQQEQPSHGFSKAHNSISTPQKVTLTNHCWAVTVGQIWQVMLVVASPSGGVLAALSGSLCCLAAPADALISSNLQHSCESPAHCGTEAE
jgi:hypothetical protein